MVDDNESEDPSDCESSDCDLVEPVETVGLTDDKYFSEKESPQDETEATSEKGLVDSNIPGEPMEQRLEISKEGPTEAPTTQVVVGQHVVNTQPSTPTSKVTRKICSAPVIGSTEKAKKFDRRLSKAVIDLTVGMGGELNWTQKHRRRAKSESTVFDLKNYR